MAGRDIPTGSSKRGPKPKTVEERRRIGNPSHRPMPNPATVTLLPTISTIPEPMRHLEPEGLALWHRIWASGATWLARDVDPEIVLHLCEQLDERETLRREVMSEGDWRQRAALRMLDAQIIGAFGSLGFNPADRGRLNVAEVVEPTRLEALLRERRGG